MTSTASLIAQRPRAAATVLLVAASVALTLGFACAVPLAGFAAIAAVLLLGASAFGAILAVWLANQVVGFGWLGYPTDASTLAWGLALGVVAVGCVATARAVLARRRDVPGTGAAFVAAFCVYEGAIYALCLASGTDVAHLTLAVVARVFLINAATFAGFLALRTVALRTGTGRRLDASLGFRHA